MLDSHIKNSNCEFCRRIHHHNAGVLRNKIHISNFFLFPMCESTTLVYKLCFFILIFAVFSETLQLHCKFRYCHKMSSLCRLSSSSVFSLWRECIVTKRLKLGPSRFHWNIAKCLNSLLDKFDYEIRKGLKLRWGGFWLRDAISWKRCEIELRWQLITNRKS